eukprot:591162-Rhodomonas_salina.1
MTKHQSEKAKPVTSDAACTELENCSDESKWLCAVTLSYHGVVGLCTGKVDVKVTEDPTRRDDDVRLMRM